jgi:hypothetical protein
MTPEGRPAFASRAGAGPPVRAHPRRTRRPDRESSARFSGRAPSPQSPQPACPPGSGADERWCQTPDRLAAAPAPGNSVRNNAAPFK